jgi:hypothetical protein
VARRKQKEAQAFVVVRLGWEERYEDDRSFDLVETEDEGRTLGRPLAVFTNKKDADARKEQLEREEREALSPFTFVGRAEYHLRGVTSLSLEQFLAKLKEIAPKARLPKTSKYDERDWNGWWEKYADTLSEEQRQGVWELLDRLELYRVMPTEVEA